MPTASSALGQKSIYVRTRNTGTIEPLTNDFSIAQIFLICKKQIARSHPSCSEATRDYEADRLIGWHTLAAKPNSRILDFGDAQRLGELESELCRSSEVLGDVPFTIVKIAGSRMQEQKGRSDNIWLESLLECALEFEEAFLYVVMTADQFETKGTPDPLSCSQERTGYAIERCE